MLYAGRFHSCLGFVDAGFDLLMELLSACGRPGDVRSGGVGEAIGVDGGAHCVVNYPLYGNEDS